LNGDRLRLQNEHIESGNRVEPCVEGAPRIAPSRLLRKAHTKERPRGSPIPLRIGGLLIELGRRIYWFVSKLAQLKGSFADGVGSANDGQQTGR
jgi:hypothetical protein